MVNENNGGNPETKFSYFAFYDKQFIAGIILIGIAVIGFFFAENGLIFFLFALPPFFFIILLPLLLCLFFIFRSVCIISKETFKIKDGEIVIRSRRVFTKLYSIDIEDINMVRIFYRESKLVRWLVALIWLNLSIEIYLENGMDLVGHAIIGSFLLYCFVFSLIAWLLFLLFPRRFLEITTESTSYVVPFPIRLDRIGNSKILYQLLENGKHNVERSIDAINKPSRSPKRRVNPFTVALVTFLIIIGVLPLVNHTIYLGEFTATIMIALGLKIFLRYIHAPFGGRVLATKNNFLKTNTKPRFFKTHVVEIIALGFLGYELILYGFRFLWWVYAGINILYLIVAISFLFLVVIYYMEPVDIMTFKDNNGLFKIEKPSNLTFKKRIQQFREYYAKFNQIRIIKNQ